MAIERHHVKSKLAVAYQLSNLPETADHIPDTELLRESSLRRMTRKYYKVYLKPDQGRKSKGIIRIERLKYGRFKLRQESRTKVVRASELGRAVHRLTGDTRYLIQRAVNSVTRDGRHFDLRCHALRIDGEWRAVGICGRLGERGSIVTTSHSGGTPTSLRKLFRRHLKYTDREGIRMVRRIRKLIIHTVSNVSKMYPNLQEFAVDMGLDTRKRLWIFEVNIEPLIEGNFKLLPDKTLYRKISRLRKLAK
ncbi:YheC/YheD family protein [Paenibacillus xerothermodurans]|uniref:YheC/YheD family protein n=1 Tax=Paenibacillus xerothermodurans TaxID=1977292 RepID=A0A2W1N550_PAEXE|nr:YheC/YheD family protein [Paenibacillus xerothermodurans]PZE19507.1 hypothetical protein CBW46_018395 [Paenibacillus xerothermodurans]